MHLSRKFVSDADIKRELSAAAFDQIEQQFAIRLDAWDRRMIRKHLRLVAGQLAWDDPKYWRGRLASFESILKKMVHIEGLMDTKILMYRDRPIPWDDGERQCRKWVAKIREYLDSEIIPLEGSKKPLKKTSEQTEKTKTRKHSKPKDQRIRDLLDLMAPVYEAAGGKGLRIHRKNGKRASKFIDFVVATCHRAGVEIPSHGGLCSIWEEAPRGRRQAKKKHQDNKK